MPKLDEKKKKALWELIRYGFSGAAVTLTNVGVYELLLRVGLVYTVANIAALVLAKVVGYVLNKFWVYKSHTGTLCETLRELWRYTLARGFTGLLDYFGLIVLVECFHADQRISKWAIVILVIIINYILGKSVVFVKKEVKQETSGNLEKYQTHNPLKQQCIKRFNAKLEVILHKSLPATDAKLRILDAGCGEGFLIEMLHGLYPQAELTGVDASESALAYAREHDTCGASFLEADITKLPFDDDAFDLVVCTEVLEHIPVAKDALAELMRVCKNVAVVTVPNEPWFCLGNLLSLKNISRLGNPIDHVNHWTYGGFIRFLRDNATGAVVQTATSFPWSIGVLEMMQGQ